VRDSGPWMHQTDATRDAWIGAVHAAAGRRRVGLGLGSIDSAELIAGKPSDRLGSTFAQGPEDVVLRLRRTDGVDGPRFVHLLLRLGPSTTATRTVATETRTATNGAPAFRPPPLQVLGLGKGSRLILPLDPVGPP
jgi:hypothetical protein